MKRDRDLDRNFFDRRKSLRAALSYLQTTSSLDGGSPLDEGNYVSVIDVGCAGSDSVKEWFEIFDVNKVLAIDARQSAVDEVALNVPRNEVAILCAALSAHGGEMRPFHSEIEGGFNSSFYAPNFNSDVVTAHRGLRSTTSSFEDAKNWITEYVRTQTLDEVAWEFVGGGGGSF